MTLGVDNKTGRVEPVTDRRIRPIKVQPQATDQVNMDKQTLTNTARGIVGVSPVDPAPQSEE